VIEIPLDVDVDDSPLPMKTEPLDTPRVEPLEIDTLPLALVLADTDAIFTSDNPSIVKDPPEPVIDALDALDVDPSAADNSTDPPVVPLPADIDTDPPVAALDPADKLMSPDEPFASPVNNDNDPLKLLLLLCVDSSTLPLPPCVLKPPRNDNCPGTMEDDPASINTAPPSPSDETDEPPDNTTDPPANDPDPPLPSIFTDPPSPDDPLPL